jgi:hypothetical protein
MIATRIVLSNTRQYFYSRLNPVLYTALMTETRPALIWFRQDLRLADNPALQAAIASGAPVLPVYIHDDEAAGEWKPGAAGRWWLHESLATLNESLNGALQIFHGDARQARIGTVATNHGESAVMKRSRATWPRLVPAFARSTAAIYTIRRRLKQRVARHTACLPLFIEMAVLAAREVLERRWRILENSGSSSRGTADMMETWRQRAFRGMKRNSKTGDRVRPVRKIRSGHL